MNMGMVSLISLVGEFCVLLIQLGTVITRPYDGTRIRFLILTAFFIAFNAIWSIVPGVSSELWSAGKNNLLLTGSFVLGIYYYYYVATELNVKNIEKGLFRKLVLSLSGSFSIGFILIYFLFNRLDYTIGLFVLLLIGVVFSFSIKILVSLLKTEYVRRSARYKGFFWMSYGGLTCISFSPVIQIANGPSVLVPILENTGFLCILSAYLVFFRYQSKQENDILMKTGFSGKMTITRELDSFLQTEFQSLTRREKLVAIYILQGMIHKEIADTLGLATNTITNYASQIYKKTNCSGKEEFLNKYAERLNSFVLTNGNTEE